MVCCTVRSSLGVDERPQRQTLGIHKRLGSRGRPYKRHRMTGLDHRVINHTSGNKRLRRDAKDTLQAGRFTMSGAPTPVSGPAALTGGSTVAAYRGPDVD
jgi:hypothetical protein